MRLHYFERTGVECGRCGATTCWSDKTGRQCRGCKHLEALHFAAADPPYCRIAGCDCKEFSK